MKLTKIFALALAAMTMTACSDDDDRSLNTAADVTVHMGETVVQVKENKGFFDVPVVVDGAANGYVEVKVKISDGTVNNDVEEPAITDAHFYVTSDRIWINPDTKTGNIEIRTVDFRLPQKTRSFTVTIESVKGATIAQPATTTVYILDKGTSPKFDQLAGNWIVTGSAYDYDKQEYSDNFNAVGTFAVVDRNNMTFTISNFMGESLLRLPLVYDYDEEVDYGDINARLGGVMATNVSFNDPIGVADILLTNGQNATSGIVAGTWNDNYTSVSFGKAELVVGIFKNGSATGYAFARFTNLSITKIPNE